MPAFDEENIKRLFATHGVVPVNKLTVHGSWSFVAENSFNVGQLGNRGSTPWRLAEHIVLKDAPSDRNSLLLRWKELTDSDPDPIHIQKLYLYNQDNTTGPLYDQYDAFGNLIATGPLPDLLKNAQPRIQSNGNIAHSGKNEPRQRIFYGAPGTGKSFQTDKIVKEIPDTIRVTFHPDSDYASFVGCYKPTMKNPDPDEKTEIWTLNADENGAKLIRGGEHIPKGKHIVYEFVPQAFTKAYELAWRKMAEWKTNGGDLERQYLVIEEINRGNCAQVFGDLFQLLDRDDDGYSKYPVDPDADLAKHLCGWFQNKSKDKKGKEYPAVVAPADGDKWKSKKAGMGDADATWDDVFAGRKLVLPPNLYIWATMNTSDQSLFPMDSAFKRRWDWKYVPIRNHTEMNWAIVVDETRKYDWWDFLKQINDVVFSKTNSEDKQLGYFFVQAKDGVVDLYTFVNKVVFYLWNTVFKDCYTECDFLKDGDRKDANGAQAYLHFSKFFDDDGKAKPDAAGQLLDKLQVKKFSPAAPAPVAPPATPAPAAAPAAPAPVAPPATPAPAAAPAPPSV